MDDISNIMGNITRMLAICGGGLAAVAITYAGIQWMLASGDPQKMAQVRMGVIGAVGGLILVGVSFIIPRVVSQLVIEPSGGVVLDWDEGVNCDRLLRDRLVVERSASTSGHMNLVVGGIQSQRIECRPEVWSPVVLDLEHGHGPTNCFKGQVGAQNFVVGGTLVPLGMHAHGAAMSPRSQFVRA